MTFGQLPVNAKFYFTAYFKQKPCVKMEQESIFNNSGLYRLAGEITDCVAFNGSIVVAL